MDQSTYFSPDDVSGSLSAAAAECADLRKCYDKRVPFKWEELPEWNTFSSFTPPPMAEGQLFLLHRYNELSGQCVGTSAGRAYWLYGRLVWWFRPEVPAKGVGEFVCG